MKKLVNFIIIAAVLAMLSWVLWHGFTHRTAEAGEEEVAEKAEGDAAAEEEKAEDFVVNLEKEKWEALDIDKAEPEKAELKPQKMAFGRVLDPTPIITLEGELASAEATLQASRAEYERSQKLLAAGEVTSRKNAEAAEAQFRADQVKLDGLNRRTLLEWGSVLAEKDINGRHKFVDELVRGNTILIRVDVLPGDAITELPKSAHVVVLGREDQMVETQAITPAADVDPKTQAQGFILQVATPPFPLRPGMALTAWLELPQEPRQGFAVPRSAILRHDGRAWVYVQEEEEKFVRKPVTLDSPLEADKGWFIPENGGIKADDLLIVSGAQSLLSEELKAQGGGEAD